MKLVASVVPLRATDCTQNSETQQLKTLRTYWCSGCFDVFVLDRTLVCSLMHTLCDSDWSTLSPAGEFGSCPHLTTRPADAYSGHVLSHAGLVSFHYLTTRSDDVMTRPEVILTTCASRTKAQKLVQPCLCRFVYLWSGFHQLQLCCLMITNGRGSDFCLDVTGAKTGGCHLSLAIRESAFLPQTREPRRTACNCAFEESNSEDG